MNQFYQFGQSRLFWIAGIVYLLLLEGIALYYQYVLDMFPCALCVQIRAWLYGAILTAAFSAVFVERFRYRFAGLILTILLLGGGLYTSWYAWGVEKGTIISNCTFGAGFPEFMPLDQWIPVLFEAQGICGQSPTMWLGISMVEWLLITLTPPMLVLLALLILHTREAFGKNS